MEWLVKYVMVVCGAGIVSFILDMIIPECSIKKAARFGIALIMTLMLCAPVLSLFTKDKKVSVLPQQTAGNIDANQLFSATRAAAERLVRLNSGFENAEVGIEMEGTRITKITIQNKNSSIVDQIKRSAAENELIKYLSVLYGVEQNNIIIVQQ